ncbi:hypothetical protein J5X84_44725 [Streptosporangiaceae bacterium NEAU-GS5]|nr:hypothetical protein [Streptosporangiaceae bacterium NEAU-GS5]
MLQRQVKAPRLTWADRALVSGLARLQPAEQVRRLQLIISPRTLLRWHTDPVKHRWTFPRRQPGRPRTAATIRRLVLQMARENSLWGIAASPGELAGLGYRVGPSTVWVILQAAGVDPAPLRSGPTWRQFLAAQAETIVAADFFHFLSRRHRVPTPVVRAVRDRTRHPRSPD